MKTFLRYIFISLTLFVVLISSGCYTKFYRPGMDDNGPFSTNQLYNRYDSTAIDTTLTRDDWYPDTYPNYSDNNYGWSYWGRPRGYTRWGFDFNHFDPGYYRSYYGYYDYYGTPWWQNRYHNPWWYGPNYGGGGGIGEPPSERPGRRDGRDPGNNGNVAQPPANAPSNAQPAQPEPKNNDDAKSNQTQEDPNKRGGRRGR